jgi:hypothetical protein
MDALMGPTLSPDKSKGTVHEGFYQYAKALYGPVADYLAPYCVGKPGDGQTTAPFWITGHSLGAASASVLASMLDAKGCKAAGVAMFAPPRSGFKDWQQAYDHLGVSPADLEYRSQRWVNKIDPIYCLPPGGAWRHVGIENRIMKDGSIALQTNIDGSACDTPEAWLEYLKAFTADPGTDLALALARWAGGEIQIILHCKPGFGWDDVWSLGACELVDVGNKLSSAFGWSPTDLIEETARVAFIGDHHTSSYEDGLGNVNFDAPNDDNLLLPGRLVHLVASTGNTALRITESATGHTCNVPANNQLTCEFSVPPGLSLVLTASAGPTTMFDWEGGCTSQTAKCNVPASTASFSATLNAGELD